MAKASRAVQTRLAITVNARYYPTDGVSDGFYIDGRIPGVRETRAADLTVDRESRSFLLSVFGRPETDSADNTWVNPFQSVGKQIKSGVSDIDTEINNLAELAVEVTGRSTLKSEDQRQPFFSGLVVMDGEVAAVTIGDGCAYLYRNDVVYPLTRDDFALEAIDYNGNTIGSLDDYIAGSAGTIRYSNIAQLEMNDCVILCNLPIMEAIGQRELLRLLYEAEDQGDAAGMIMTQASSKLPGEPLQIAIGFVESVVAEERTGRLNLGRFATGAIPAQKPFQEARDQDLARTQRFHSSSMSNLLDEQDRMFKAKAAGESESSPTEPVEPATPAEPADVSGFQRPQTEEASVDLFSNGLKPQTESAPVPQKEDENMANDDYDRLDTGRGRYPKSIEDLYGEAEDNYQPDDDYQDFTDADQIEYKSAPGSSRARRKGFRSDAQQTLPPMDRRRSAYSRSDTGGFDPYAPTPRESERLRGGFPSRAQKSRSSAYNDYDDYDGDYDEDPYYGDYDNNYAQKEKTKRLVFYIVFGVLIVVCIFALIKLLNKSDAEETKPAALESNETVEAEEPADSNITLPAGETTDPSSSEGTEATDPEPTDTEATEEMQYVEHLVVKGDTLWGLAKKYFPNASRTKAMDAIMAANGWTDPENKSNLKVGKKVKIPTKLEDKAD
ncbi:MAG: LysM peptidoglycan-binding domain-containing protein [Saccharofermentanales bacterium]|jgi:LysM repeat protein